MSGRGLLGLEEDLDGDLKFGVNDLFIFSKGAYRFTCFWTRGFG